MLVQRSGAVESSGVLQKQQYLLEVHTQKNRLFGCMQGRFGLLHKMHKRQSLVDNATCNVSCVRGYELNITLSNCIGGLCLHA